MRIASTQFNYRYGTQLHFPYSVACLVANANIDADWLPCAVYRGDWAQRLDEHTPADVLLSSCYVWNMGLTSKYIAAWKARNPRGTVIVGGPQIPDDPSVFLAEQPAVDIVVHGEGEAIIGPLLSHLRERPALPGVRYRDRIHTEPRARIDDLGALRSPYLSGAIWKIVQRDPRWNWIASWETNRGCPYQCTYCDWGSSTYTKLRQYPMDRLLAEIDWLALADIPYIDCCDANFGMLARDIDLARRLRNVAVATGWRSTLRTSWAKNTSDKIIPVAQTLMDGKLLNGVGLALESLDPVTLATIKRKNVAFTSFSDLTTKFSQAGLPTFTELIRGMPGETLDSFRAGLRAVVNDSEIGAIYIYNCCVLPNAPMADPHYRATHQIETIRSPIYLAHSTTHAAEDVEYEDIIVSTATTSRQDMERAHLLSWLVLTFHSLGLLKDVARTTPDPMAFYEAVLAYGEETRGILHQEIEVVKAYIHAGYNGQGWDHCDPTWGTINWPIEEASWLRLANHPHWSRVELPLMLSAMGMAMPVITAQIARWRRWSPDEDRHTYARDTMWYGRRRGAFLVAK